MGAAKCISNQGASGQVVLFMILFSLCVQAAEGLHYGIVPYVSRPALGIVSGMVGAGGNMGIMVIAVTATMFFVYFPDMGGMLFPAGGLGSYDPQLIKPPDDYRGADSMDMNALDALKTGEGAKTTTTEAVSSA